ncbi:hypothetical protein GCM10023084_73360 [Streptomyces lacrimifluminis]|uniref:Uncharacterized protein n=1 Tax=Streptomyces lacrimifluminis TaxID=1500077 RepID=A0A917P6H3_9ACTN|nr:hypothetical protein GCM10012282_71440 [Streptomyces lacrimifluminis]
MPEDDADPIIEFVAQGLVDSPARKLWRNLVAVDLSFYTSFIAEEIHDEGRAEGRAQGLAEVILFVLEKRGLAVSDEVRERITAADGPETLHGWIARSVTATTAAEILTPRQKGVRATPMER